MTAINTILALKLAFERMHRFELQIINDILYTIYPSEDGKW